MSVTIIIIKDDEPKQPTVRCDYCSRPATVNVQKLWVKFPIVGGVYQEPEVVDDFTQNPSGPDNLHLCDYHYSVFCDGEPLIGERLKEEGQCYNCRFMSSTYREYSAGEIKCSCLARAGFHDMLTGFNDNGGFLWLTPIEDIDSQEVCGQWQGLPDSELFECRMCNLKYPFQFCLTKDVNVCMFCGEDQ